MTTRPTPGVPWDDERVAAAFAARASRRGTPEGLANASIAALRTRPTSTVALRRLLAPAAVVILALGAVSGGLALRGASGVAESPGAPTPESSPFPSASEAVGLPVISVTDAIAIRDAGVDDGEIAVRGWLAPLVQVPCPVPLTPATSPVQLVCPGDQGILMAEPESLVTSGPNGLSRRSPTGPYFQISLDFQIHLDDLPGGPRAPVEIVVVGHFDDRRSSWCPADTQAACRDHFMVDRVDRVNDHLQPTSVLVLHKGTGAPFDDAKHIIDAVRPGVAILSAVHVDSAGLRYLEPALADHGGGLIQESATWVVRVLDRDTLATYAVVDSTGSIYELTADGPVLMALSTPGERASPEPTPAPRVRSTFTIEIGPVDRPVSIEVVDRTGFLDVARAATAAELSRESRSARPGRLALRNLARDTILVTWTGSVCDASPRLTIDPGVPDQPPRDLRLTDERPGCDTIGIGRAVVLQFSRDLNARDLVGTEEIQLVESNASTD